MKIDSHQHYWKIERTDYGWLKPSVGKIYADFMPEHLKPLLQQYDIQMTVVVQAAPSADETAFLLGIADREETLAGVCGWLDLLADDFRQQWTHFRANTKFVGIRPMIQDLPSEWILQDKVVDNLQFLTESGFAVDLQSNMRHLPYLVQLMKRVPTLRAVVDHLAKPPIASGNLEPWSGYMSQLAAYPNVYCKLSGMVYGREGDWTVETIKLFAQRAIDVFGRKRVMFGTDWPVCLMSATYPQVIDLMAACIRPDWTQEEREDVYAWNAARFYGLQV
jgi:L-fuconolactonase